MYILYTQLSNAKVYTFYYGYTIYIQIYIYNRPIFKVHCARSTLCNVDLHTEPETRNAYVSELADPRGLHNAARFSDIVRINLFLLLPLLLLLLLYLQLSVFLSVFFADATAAAAVAF